MRLAARFARSLAVVGALVSVVLLERVASASPNTHAPAISTWDPRASSVVFGLGRAVSGEGEFTLASYNANFSSTSGILSAQFGAHYVTYTDPSATSGARGFSAGGVALISLPLSERSAVGIPGSTFAFYAGGVPTGLFSGQRNFISVPLVLGIGLPLAPASAVTITPWAELSPGLNFDTTIRAVSTSAAIQSAMDGTLTRQEVEDLVEQGLDISRKTTVGTRAGLALALHLGRDVDIDATMMLGAGHNGAIGLGAALVFRWDSMVPGVRTDAERDSAQSDVPLSCSALETRLRACPGFAAPPAAAAAPAQPAPAQSRAPAATPDRADDSPALSSSEKKKPSSPPPDPAAATAPKAPAKALELPPLQAAPPRPQ